MDGSFVTTTGDRRILKKQLIERLQRRSLFCQKNSSSKDEEKLNIFEEILSKRGFILRRSTLKFLRESFSSIFRSAFKCENIEKCRSNGIHFRPSFVKALPSRRERGTFLLVQIGSLTEDIRFTLIRLNGQKYPSYRILHSRAFDVCQSIRQSSTEIFFDHLATELNRFLEQVRCFHLDRTGVEQKSAGKICRLLFPRKIY